MSAPVTLNQAQQVQSTQANANPVTTQTNAVNPTNTASTISSAAPAQSRGIIAQVKHVVSQFFSNVRWILSKIPVINWLVGKSTPAPVTTVPNPANYTDAQRLVVIRDDLRANGSVDASTAKVLDQAAIDHLVNVFSGIVDPVVKSEAFHAVLNAVNSTPQMAKDCFNALSPEMKAGFQTHCERVNGSQIYNGHDHQGGVGEHIAYEDTRSDVAIRAAAQYHAALAAAAAAPVTTTTGPQGVQTTQTPPASPRAQMRALLAALNNTSIPAGDLDARTAVVRTAFDALNQNLKDQIKAQVWNLNNRVDTLTSTGYSYANQHGNYGSGIGAFVVGYDVLDATNNDNLFRRAVERVLLTTNNA